MRVQSRHPRLPNAEADQWIEASRALAIAGDGLALCRRLHAGLIQSKANVFVAGEQQAEHVRIPQRFWWAEGHEALQQNWEAGDFATEVDGAQHQAFGTSFALSGLLAMLTAERRASIATSLSVVGYANWVSAMEARRLVIGAKKVPGTIAERLLLQHARLGFLSARTVLAEGTNALDLDRASREGGKARRAWAEREWDVAPWFWNDLSEEEIPAIDWELGVFTARRVAEPELVKLTGVHFLKASLSSVFAADTPQPVANSSTKNLGGRPPAAFADDLMCAVWGLIYRGDLIPKTQADVERTLLQWASNNEQKLSETAARDKARKIFKAVARA